MRADIRQREIVLRVRRALFGPPVDLVALLRIANWRALGVLLLAILAGCCPKPITRPVLIETERRVVEPIPSDLLRAHPIATGRVSECPAVAAARRAEIEACNADKAAIRSMQERSE